MKQLSFSRLYAAMVLTLGFGYWGVMSVACSWALLGSISWRCWYLIFGWMFLLLVFAVEASPWIDYGLKVWRRNSFSPWLIDVKGVAGKVSSALYTLLSIVTLALPFVLESDFTNSDFDILVGFNIVYLLLTVMLIVRKIYRKRMSSL